MSAQRKKRKARRSMELERNDARGDTRDDHYAGVFKVVMQKGGQLIKGGLNYQEAHELWKNTPGTIFVYQ